MISKHEEKNEKYLKIGIHRSKRKQKRGNLKRINPSNKVVEASFLPTVLNLNPRSIYNKVEEFKTFVEEHEIDLVCLSESWEREKETLKDIIDMNNYEVVSNYHQRQGVGGRPAIIVDKSKFEIEDLTNTIISIPWGIEVV